MGKGVVRSSASFRVKTRVSANGSGSTGCGLLPGVGGTCAACAVDGSRRGCRLLSESCGRTRDCGCKEPPTPFVLVVHIWILQQRFSHGSLKPARPRARMPPRSAAADLGTLANSLLLVGRSARAPAFTPRTPQIMTERTAIIIPRMNLRLRRLFITVAGELSVRRAATLVHSSLNGITKSRRSRRRLPPNGSHARQ